MGTEPQNLGSQKVWRGFSARPWKGWLFSPAGCLEAQRETLWERVLRAPR